MIDFSNFRLPEFLCDYLFIYIQYSACTIVNAPVPNSSRLRCNRFVTNFICGIPDHCNYIYFTPSNMVASQSPISHRTTMFENSRQTVGNCSATGLQLRKSHQWPAGDQRQVATERGLAGDLLDAQRCFGKMFKFDWHEIISVQVVSMITPQQIQLRVMFQLWLCWCTDVTWLPLCSMIWAIWAI